MSAFCSRNAHDRNVLVRRPQSGLTRVPFQRRVNEQAWREHLYRSMRTVKGSLGHSPKREVLGIGRTSFDVRIRGSTRLPYGER